jgi:hypothetical protein
MARGKVDEAIVAAIAFLGKHFFKVENYYSDASSSSFF